MRHPIQIVSDIGDLIRFCQGLEQNVKFHRLQSLLGSLCLNPVLIEDVYQLLTLQAQILCELCDFELLIDTCHISS